MQQWEQSTFTKGKYSNYIYLILSVSVFLFSHCLSGCILANKEDNDHL